ncbi:MAG: ATP-binding protein, partial [Planctomycetaceae bacterium]|nr:ATP-binding protein [Planctomycetaceae bacterium]
MKIRDFFKHFGIEGNPFSEEDAQKDQVFQSHCIETTFHPAWDKLYGKPAEPDTAIIFGAKGSGKTALRYQIIQAIKKYNAEHPERHPFVIEYANWNPFLDHFRRRFSERKSTESVLSAWQLWDHIDAILSLGVTQIIDQILIPEEISSPA